MPGVRRWILPSPATEPPRNPRTERDRSRLRQEQRRLIAQERQFLPFLVATLLPVLLMPWASFHRGALAMLLLPVLFTLLVLQSLRTLPGIESSTAARWSLLAYRGFGMLGILGAWFPVLRGGWPSAHLRVALMVPISIFLVFTAVRLVRMLARVPRVNVQVLAGAAAGYVHLGLTGGVLATLIQLVQPGSFTLGSAARHSDMLDRLLYFSFVTVAGLGYGDVLPADPVGERFTIVLSLCGTLYVTLLVGLLLGRFIATEELELLEEAEADALDRGLDRRDVP